MRVHNIRMQNFISFSLLLCFLAPAARASVEGFGDKTTVAKVFYDIPDFQLDVGSRDGSGQLQYRPNLSSVTGVSVGFMGMIGVGFGFRQPVSQEEIDRKGETFYDDWRFALALDQFSFDLNYQSYRGFYLKNSEGVDSGGADYYQNADLKAERLAAEFKYILWPENYSPSLLTDQVYRQSESGGSFIFGASLLHNRVSGPEAWVPTEKQAEFGGESGLSEATFLSLLGKAGYGYNLIWRDFYVGAQALLGLGVHLTSYKGGNFSESRQDPAYKGEGIVGFGYNGESFLAGVNYSMDWTPYRTGGADVTVEQTRADLFVGGRF
jgi:hypothetical protein